MRHEQIDDRLIAKIKALLETRGCTEAEASARIGKAQELLEKYGLEMAELEKGGVKRSDTKKSGGLYTWQRKLWDGVANLNFCVYFSIKGLTKGSKYENRLVGSHANVIATTVMAEYLQGVIESLAQQWAKEQGYGSVFVRDAIAYREGMTRRIVDRLADRRRQILTEARQEQERAKAERASATFADGQTATALTILDVVSSEADFNNDYLNNWEMGTTARNRAKAEAADAAWRAKYHAEKAARDAAEAANPALKAARLEQERKWAEEWAKKEAKAQARRNKTPPRERYRRETAEEQRARSYGYSDGYRKGADVGIDQQVDKTNTARIG